MIARNRRLQRAPVAQHPSRSERNYSIIYPVWRVLPPIERSDVDAR